MKSLNGPRRSWAKQFSLGFSLARGVLGLTVLAVLSQCSTPLELHNDSKQFVENGLSQMMVASTTFAGAINSSTVGSGTPLTVKLKLVNPKRLAATYSLSWNVANTFFSVLPPANPTSSDPEALSIPFTLNVSAEHQDIVFTLGIFVPSTGKTYPSAKFQTHCDSLPDPVENMALGQDASDHAFVVFTLPEGATDDDLTSVILSYQDVQDPAHPGPVTTVTLGVGAASLTAVSSPDLLSSVGATYKRYFMPSVTPLHAYAFQATLVDAAGQKSTAQTVGAAGINYSVTYNANGGTGSPVTNTYPYGSSITLNDGSLFSFTNHAFKEWYTTASGTGGAGYPGSAPLVMNSGDLVLYAQWTPLYHVTYDANFGSGTVPTDSVAHEANDSVTVKSGSTLTRSGYTFMGWNTQQDGSGPTTYQANDPLTMPASDVTLYAVWKQYTLTYSSADGNSYTGTVPAATTYPANATVTVLGNTGTLAGTNLVFTGWSTGMSGGGTAYAPGDTFTITADTTLYPTWMTISGGTITSVQGNPKNVVIPEGVTSLGSAFQNLTSLVSISLPSTLTSVPTQPLIGCSNLASITSSSTSFPVVNGMLLNAAQTQVLRCPSKFSGVAAIPSGVTGIDASAFTRCSNLTSISFPSSLTAISGNAFTDMSSSIAITIPSTVTQIGGFAFLRSSITSVVIPSTVTAIATDGFLQCPNLTTVDMQPLVPPSLGTTVFDLPAANPSLQIHVVNSTVKALYDVDSSYAGLNIVTP